MKTILRRILLSLAVIACCGLSLASCFDAGNDKLAVTHHQREKNWRANEKIER